jgi:hypothetical protein
MADVLEFAGLMLVAVVGIVLLFKYQPRSK